jgi:hypothetical protein
MVIEWPTGTIDVHCAVLSVDKKRFSLEKAKGSWKRTVGRKELLLFLRGYGLSQNEAGRAVTGTLGGKIKSSYRE